VVVAMVVAMDMRMLSGFPARPPGFQHPEAQDDQEQGRDHLKVGKHLFGDKVVGGHQARDPQEKHAENVRRRDDQSQDHSVYGPSASAHEIGTHEGLPVPRAQCVDGAQKKGQRQGNHEEARIGILLSEHGFQAGNGGTLVSAARRFLFPILEGIFSGSFSIDSLKVDVNGLLPSGY